jgi:hypothetical protein
MLEALDILATLICRATFDVNLAMDEEKCVSNFIFLIRAALHIDHGPIHCVRGLKSSLVIGPQG